MKNDPHLKKEIGLVVATALVVGNMIGSGIFMLPATLANSSGPGATMMAWILTGAGSIFLALSFANLGSKMPKTGGPYEYSKAAFGDFMGFLNAWLYWNGSWIGNAAIITSIASYTGRLIPLVNDNRLVAFLYTSGILWIFTIINIMGTKKAGIMQTATTIFKLVLFLFFIGVCAFYFNPEFIKPAFPETKGIGTVSAAEIMLLVKMDGRFSLWRFIKASIVPLLGFTYAVWAIYGSGSEVVMYGFLLILLGVPFYLYMKLKEKFSSEKDNEENIAA